MAKKYTKEQIKSDVGDNDFIVTFIKKDKTTRTMKASINFDKYMPNRSVATPNSKSRTSDGILTVLSLDKDVAQFRSVTIANITDIKIVK